VELLAVVGVTFHGTAFWALYSGMTDDNEFEHLPEQIADDGAGQGPDAVARAADGVSRRAVSGGAGSGVGQNEMAGLVLLINAVFVGLGTLYMTTKSVGITLASALLVLLIVVVVLVAKCVTAPALQPGHCPCCALGGIRC
jgi:hypothetical protein